MGPLMPFLKKGVVFFLFLRNDCPGGESIASDLSRLRPRRTCWNLFANLRLNSPSNADFVDGGDR